MRIVTLMTIRNEELFLPKVLNHLKNQGIETCLIDNGSTDSSLEIAHSFLGRGVLRIEELPYNGSFELTKVLKNEERLAGEIKADWFIHHDADEVREAPQPFKTLSEGIMAVDQKGYNAINFDEFVFLPTNEDESFEGLDYVKEMLHYYFFEPVPLRRINAWKNLGIPIDLKSSGGHRINFEGRKIAPQNFILRHYIMLSKAHCISKYGTRVYSNYEVNELGWHRKRADFKPGCLVFPSKNDLCNLEEGFWNKSHPYNKHLFNS